MTPDLKQAFAAEIRLARREFDSGRLDVALRHLERAHLLGQRYVLPHVRSHAWMLRIGWQRRSAREVWGQALRVAMGALGSALGFVPIGNTGGTDISMFKRLPIPQEFVQLLKPRK